MPSGNIDSQGHERVLGIIGHLAGLKGWPGTVSGAVVSYSVVLVLRSCGVPPSSSRELITGEHLRGVQRVCTADTHSRVWDGELAPHQHEVRAIQAQTQVWAHLT